MYGVVTTSVMIFESRFNKILKKLQQVMNHKFD